VTYTKTFAIGERLRIVGGEHAGRLGTVIECSGLMWSGMAVRIDAEDGKPAGPPITTIENGALVTRSKGGLGGRGGFLAHLNDFEWERVS
jgi:hypothetical protein